MNSPAQAPISALAPILARVRRDVTWQKWSSGAIAPRRIPLTEDLALEHLAGRRAVGACPLSAGASSVRLALLDLDSHKGAVPWPDMIAVLDKVLSSFSAHGLHGVPFRSSGGHGMHVYFVWAEPQDAYSVRGLLAAGLKSIGFKSGTGGIDKKEIEVFPKQDHVPEDGYGSMFVLPLSGQSAPIDPLFLDILPNDQAPLDWPLSDPVPVLERPARRERVQLDYRDDEDMTEGRRVLDKIPNSDDAELDYDDWRNVIFGIHHRYGDAGLPLAHEFSSRSAKYDPEFLDNRVWPYISDARDQPITWATVRRMAGESATELTPAELEELISDEGDSATPPPDSEFRLTDWDSTKIFAGEPAPYEWLVDRVFPHGRVSVLAADGGVGKTYLLQHLETLVAVGNQASCAFGQITRSGTAVLLAAEDTTNDLHHRQAALGGPAAGFLVVPMLDTKGGVRPLFGLNSQSKAPGITPFFLDLSAQLKALPNLQCVGIDTLQSFASGLDFNNPEHAEFAIAQLDRLAYELGASIIVTHHVRKGRVESASAARESIRGSGGLVNKARCAVALWEVGEKAGMEACKALGEAWGPQKAFYLAVVKANGPADFRQKLLIRDDKGVLRDRSTELPSQHPESRDQIAGLLRAIHQMREDGVALTKTGQGGVYARRKELPTAYQGMSRHPLEALIQRLLDSGQLELVSRGVEPRPTGLAVPAEALPDTPEDDLSVGEDGS